MGILAPAQTYLTFATARSDVDRPRLGPEMDRLLGLMIVSLFPAVFWVAVIDAVAALFAAPLPVATLAGIGGVIAAFLATVCGAMMSNRP